jgi:HEPN domain-containing protein
VDRENHYKEWQKQAVYDLDTARVMWENGRYIYCIFMCHLAVEKALKALYVKEISMAAPKLHSLVYLAQAIKIDMPDTIKEFIDNLDEVSVPTRYPDELERLLKEYSEGKTQLVFKKAEEALKWLTERLEK